MLARSTGLGLGYGRYIAALAHRLKSGGDRESLQKT